MKFGDKVVMWNRDTPNERVECFFVEHADDNEVGEFIGSLVFPPEFGQLVDYDSAEAIK